MNARKRRIEERKLIKLSILSGSILTLWAIVVGILVDSKSIIFDAMFSMVGLSLSGVSLLVTDFVRKPDDTILPFGRSQFEPFAISIQSTIIILVCIYSLATSIIDIMNGGKVVELGIALPYLITSIIACFLFWLYFKRKAKEISSEYIRIESTEWQLDALLSMGVLLGLSMAYLFKSTRLEYLIPYLDPAMVVIISILFLRVPIQTLWKNIRELLQFAPDDDVEEQIHIKSEALAAKYGFSQTLVRVSKTGGSYNIEIDFLLSKKMGAYTLNELDDIRQELYEQIHGDYGMWLTISFSTELKWIM